MMRYAVEVGGKTVQVELDSAADGPVRAFVDGRPCDAEVSTEGDRIHLRVGDQTLDLFVEWRASEVVLHWPGGAVVARPTGERDVLGSSGSAAGKGPSVVRAPMPGRVVQVLVREGAEVTTGTPLLVVEAMKMENELRAPRAGTVLEVKVKAGQTVEANEELVRIGS